MHKKKRARPFSLSPNTSKHLLLRLIPRHPQSRSAKKSLAVPCFFPPLLLLLWISDEILPLAAFDILLHQLFFSCMLCLLQMMEFYERVSGARMHAAYVRPGGVALVSVKQTS